MESIFFFFLQTFSPIFEGHSEFEAHLFIGVLTAVYGYYPEMCDTFFIMGFITKRVD